MQSSSVALDHGGCQNGHDVFRERLDALSHHQQQPGSTGVVSLAYKLPRQQVAVQQVQGGEQRGGGSRAALLQVQTHPEQLVPGHL